MREVMFDIETLDTESSACLVQFGAVVFEGNKILARLKRNVDVQSQIDRGRTISWSTLVFWLEQSNEARQSILAPEQWHGVDAQTWRGKDRIDVPAMLTEFSRLCSAYQVERYWAKGRMDHDVMASLYEMFKINAPGRVPWTFRQPRDLRGILDIGEMFALEYGDNSLGHDALADSEFQLSQLVLIRQHLTELRGG